MAVFERTINVSEGVYNRILSNLQNPRQHPIIEATTKIIEEGRIAYISAGRFTENGAELKIRG